jgi:hypothetical protein
VAIPGEASGPATEHEGPVRFWGGYAVGCLLAGAAAGIPGALLWTKLASPPSGVLTSSGVVFGETQLNQDVGVTIWFLVTGVAVSFVVGLLSAWRGSRYGVPVVLAVVLACGVASLVSYWMGVHVFGPDTKSQLASAKVGQQITAPLSVGTRIAFLGWPVGGLVGTLVAIWWWWPRTRSSRAASHVTTTAATH